MSSSLLNANPIIYSKKLKKTNEKESNSKEKLYNEWEREPLDKNEIFELIRGINDPEHPLTLEELHVVQEDLISVDLEESML